MKWMFLLHLYSIAHMKNLFLFNLCFVFCFAPLASHAQAMHFSQYYNAPLLTNPANAALMNETDYRLSVQHRMQWVALPAPYTTTSVCGDFQAFRNKNETNWMGLGFAFFNDNVGDGKLNLFRSEIFLAYHVQIGMSSMISAGASASYNSRSVNFSKFSYPVQWDGYLFDRSIPNQEDKGLEKSNYNSISAGVNYAYFPTENVYLKLGYGIKNINKPTETFFKGGENTLDFRHTGNIDLLLKTSENVILNPSAFYSTQSGAKEILYGTMVIYNMYKPTEQIGANQFLFGAYHRLGDAVVGVVGIQRNGARFTASYDYTLSALPVSANKSTGAFELSLKYEGLYGENSKGRQLYHCPRF